MESKGATRVPSTGAKVIKVLTAEGKVIMRLPSTGLKMLKMIIQMENEDGCDRCDECDSSLRVLGRGVGGVALTVWGADGMMGAGGAGSPVAGDRDRGWAEAVDGTCRPDIGKGGSVARLDGLCRG